MWGGRGCYILKLWSENVRWNEELVQEGVRKIRLAEDASLLKPEADANLLNPEVDANLLNPEVEDNLLKPEPVEDEAAGCE